METTLKATTAKSTVTEKNKVSSFWEKVEFSRFGIISMLIVVLGCIGGMAASYGAHGDILQIAMIVFPTIIALALVLAVAPMRLITYVSAIAIVLDIIVLLF